MEMPPGRLLVQQCHPAWTLCSVLVGRVIAYSAEKESCCRVPWQGMTVVNQWSVCAWADRNIPTFLEHIDGFSGCC